MPKIIGASLGNCVHVAGVNHFLEQARDEGWETIYLGPAVSVEDILACVRRAQPDVAAIGYRLTPQNVLPLVKRLRDGAKTLPKQPKWVFGGTRPVADAVRALGFFDTIFDSTEDLDDTIAYLRGAERKKDTRVPAQDLVGRIAEKRPYPLLRHHFGLPSFADTVKGVREIAQSRVLDVVSLGIDQNTQEYFFRPDLRDPAMDGAGGVPVRTEEEFIELKEASQTGNFPLMRCYSGTADVLRLADTLKRTIENAWCAVPLCWYNELDGRGARDLTTSIQDAQQLVAWHAKRGIPVEMNEPHHWGLRDAHDTISVAMSYISAYNAKKLGVTDYISQTMFNIPGAMSFSMDLAKVLAQIALTESLADEKFHVYRETRAGLPFLSGDLDVAKGQLAASTMLQMAVRPDIIHVVGYSEAEHAATSNVVIESAKIVRGVIRSTLSGNADMTRDPAVLARKETLLREARVLIERIRDGCRMDVDPLTDPETIARAVRVGILDAPHIQKNETYRGNLTTRMVNGYCAAWDADEQRELTETERLNRLAKEALYDEIG